MVVGTVSAATLLTPYLGIFQSAALAYLGGMTSLKLAESGVSLFGKTQDYLNNKAFVEDVQKLVDNDIEKFLESLDNVPLDEDYRNNINKWSRQIKDFQQYLAALDRRFSQIEQNIDVLLKNVC